MYKIFSYIPRLSSEIGVTRVFIFEQNSILNQHFTCLMHWLVACGSVSGVATAAKTNVALVSAVGFSFHHICNSLWYFEALLSYLHYDLILLFSALSAVYKLDSCQGSGVEWKSVSTVPRDHFKSNMDSITPVFGDKVDINLVQTAAQIRFFCKSDQNPILLTDRSHYILQVIRSDLHVAILT